ncbi:MAG: hypothetical protein GEV04_24800 [Actinophytocola sp.]|nr:hypothetical protein [Actinophytocola sp.]
MLASVPSVHTQRERWLSGLLDGSHLVTGAFDGALGRAAAVTAVRKGDDVVVRGEIASVAGAAEAAAVVVPMRSYAIGVSA